MRNIILVPLVISCTIFDRTKPHDDPNPSSPSNPTIPTTATLITTAIAGAVTPLAGTGAAGAQNGNSAIATFNAPQGLAIDNAGNIYVADGNNNQIRKISPL